MAQKIVTDKDLYPILPIYINATKHFYDAFGNTEREISARWIVQLCQSSLATRLGHFPRSMTTLGSMVLIDLMGKLSR
ncbi:MAG: hypothetical protein Athens101428_80 [Candidatus Berkelbacteria bacterium Athens1014_28]|uniref:Uncharacterized protein n=1 Tax=Candidatus Berkelbacteria bacterium Athens1014_28 TaxID=2017145 RepID=A0A554LQ01_9BACT|nr:MAG: hypothetical protein Athens101428_80 [Candidatus Berkelbacteria bacterium Athens1014_28]